MNGLLDVVQASSYLGLSPATLRKWVFERRVPFVRLGRRVLFRLEDLDGLVLSCLVMPRQERRVDA